MSERVMYLVRSWPRLSQTFIVGEILALEHRGVELAILSLVRSGEQLVQPQVDRIRANVTYLEDAARRPWHGRVRTHIAVLAGQPRRYLATALHAVRNPGLGIGYGECTTLECFGHAVQTAATIERFRAAGDTVVHVHAHFAHDPALVALLTRRLTGLPFSFTAHARDLYQIPASSLTARAAEAETVVTCCQANAAYIATTVPAAVLPPVHVIHHGVDLHRFTSARGKPSSAVTRITSVGRLVEKKGFAELLGALALLKSQGAPAFTCQILGDGPLADSLAALRDRLGLVEVEFVGAKDTTAIVAALSCTDVFVLTPHMAADGDRDGIPNVLVEAMASGVAVVATAVGGVPELIRDGDTGLLAPPGDRAAIAERVSRLLDDPGLRARLGAAARRSVEQDHDVDAAASELERILLPHRRAHAQVSR